MAAEERDVAGALSIGGGAIASAAAVLLTVVSLLHPIAVVMLGIAAVMALAGMGIRGPPRWRGPWSHVLLLLSAAGFLFNLVPLVTAPWVGVPYAVGVVMATSGGALGTPGLRPSLGASRPAGPWRLEDHGVAHLHHLSAAAEGHDRTLWLLSGMYAGVNGLLLFFLITAYYTGPGRLILVGLSGLAVSLLWIVLAFHAFRVGGGLRSSIQALEEALGLPSEYSGRGPAFRGVADWLAIHLTALSFVGLWSLVILDAAGVIGILPESGGFLRPASG